MILKAVAFTKVAGALAPVGLAKAVASGHTAASRSFCAYWLRAGSGSKYSPYPARITFFEFKDQAIPTRGPKLSLTRAGAKNGLPASTTLLKGGSERKASGMHGAALVTLHFGGIAAAPIIQRLFCISKLFQRRPSKVF